ncbi:alpha-glucan family phosphorylase [Paraglaciecola sp. L3A3]|uniref:alpha-glucan family phosphorylase n=1 Tax=Paraglaciecola sp. L3A3 TaxID=2686358 RepID=UPI00131CA0F0|nr:alpha-glucan family phosphorylase [Paraglaciecola sp. L3A3]
MDKHFPSHSALVNKVPTELDGFETLAELALDLRWSWNHAADNIWRQLDPELWALTHNPWGLLQTVSRDQISKVLADPIFRSQLDELIQTKREAAKRPGWFQQNHNNSELTTVAYFSMEFMLSDSLPIYSGGLGNVAGDQLKAASDLGAPVIGIGLLYQQGYFRQLIDNDGTQQAVYPYNDPGQLPISPLRYPNGEWLRIKLDLPGHPIWLRAWQVQVGRVKLYLLDSNDSANYPPFRAITSELYGGTNEMRLTQELVLGIGGWRLLSALGIEPEVCHLNEGHASFAILERAREYMVKNTLPFATALAATRAGNVFTTHTAVEAGFDRYSPALIEQWLGDYANTQLGISTTELLALGRENPSDSAEAFNMAYLAIRGSGAINGVSALHGKVSRQLFSRLFPRWPIDEVPIEHVTNGVHTPSWDSAGADKLWTKACGKDRWLGTIDNLGKSIRSVSNAELWHFRSAASQTFVTYIREHLGRQLAASGATDEYAAEAEHLFNPKILTLGFARRFATYKRPNLLLHDPARLLRLLTNPERPVQLILAGKAHPADLAGQALIKQWVQFIRQPQVRQHVIFLNDYNMLLSEQMVAGVDVWLNTPQRPWEASGTSGMKVLVNGGLNLSELDGWWAEAYRPDIGWALGDGEEHGDDPTWDAKEAEELYDLLEQEVIPEFYDRDINGIPINWTTRMRQSMARLTPQYSTNRVVREYTEQRYIPAAKTFRARTANKGKLATQIASWQQNIAYKWPGLRVDGITARQEGEQYLFAANLLLNGLTPEDVKVELYANILGSSDVLRYTMQCIKTPDDPMCAFLYRRTIPARQAITEYTLRIIPLNNQISSPLELNYIMWEH